MELMKSVETGGIVTAIHDEGDGPILGDLPCHGQDCTLSFVYV